MRRVAGFMVPVLLVSFALAGCGGVSEDKPLPEVRAVAEAMTADDLQAMVDKYKAAIEAKKGGLQKLQQKVSKIPVSELMGEEAKALKADIDELSKSVKALSERLNIYAQELRSSQ